LVLYNSKRPHKALALMTPVEYILKENKNCNMWWTHTKVCGTGHVRVYCFPVLVIPSSFQPNFSGSA
ncbi:hypothetical protein UYN87_22205, partial [Escherichia coli]|nr:hypothetical protein [Escherichia coli]MDY8384411.1 hypothetical protein [Escherichia coli]